MSTLPTTSRAVVFPSPSVEPELRTYPIPIIERGGVLLRVLASEVCGTDVHLWHGKLNGVPYPLIPGHISVGIIEATGGAVFAVDGARLTEGQPVAFLDVHGTCNSCRVCLVDKAPNRCPYRRVYGITFGAEPAPGLAGGWADYLYLRPGTHILPLAENVTPDDWIGAGCGLPTAVHATELAHIRLGDRVLIQGSGPVGLSACALAILSGAGWVGIIGAPDIRLAAARAFGADLTIDVTRTTPEARHEAILEATGGLLPDIVIEASGNPLAVREGCELVRDAGRYVIVGQYTDNGDVLLNPHLHINRKHLEVRGCWGSDFSHVQRAMDILSRFGDRFKWSSLISKKYTLEEAAIALRDVEAGRVVKAVIVPGKT